MKTVINEAEIKKK